MIQNFLSGVGEEEVVLTIFFKSSTYFIEGCMDLPQEVIGPLGSNCFLRGSILVFLRKPIVTCDLRPKVLLESYAFILKKK